MYIKLTRLVFIVICSLPFYSFAYSGYWSVLNKSNESVEITRTLAEHGDFHCSTANNDLNKSCVVGPNESAEIHLTTTSSQIHEDFQIKTSGIPTVIGAEVKYECTTTTGLPAFCTDGGSHTFTTGAISGVASSGSGIYFMDSPQSSQQILVAGTYNPNPQVFTQTDINNPDSDGGYVGHFRILDTTGQQDKLIKSGYQSYGGGDSYYGGKVSGDSSGTSGHFSPGSRYGDGILFQNYASFKVVPCSASSINCSSDPYGLINFIGEVVQGTAGSAVVAIIYYCGANVDLPVLCTAGNPHQFLITVDRPVLDNFYYLQVDANGTNGIWVGTSVDDSQTVEIVQSEYSNVN